MAVRPRRAAIPVRWWPNWLPAGTIAVFALAFVARLVPVLRGGGLFGIDTYDDSVHYSAALALVHGVLPYRDFLFLHPPGVVVALSPFAAFGAATHDGWGFAAGRIAWMLMGSATAALIVVALRGVGPLGVLVGGIGVLDLPARHPRRAHHDAGGSDQRPAGGGAAADRHGGPSGKAPVARLRREWSPARRSRWGQELPGCCCRRCRPGLGRFGTGRDHAVGSGSAPSSASSPSACRCPSSPLRQPCGGWWWSIRSPGPTAR